MKWIDDSGKSKFGTSRFFVVFLTVSNLTTVHEFEWFWLILTWEVLVWWTFSTSKIVWIEALMLQGVSSTKIEEMIKTKLLKFMKRN